jgi:glycosyltransferase involved in cell wall biosynthesis
MIGDGPDRTQAQALADKYQLTNVSFIDWLEPEQLVQRVARADICLGAFGSTPQSIMTIQNKIYAGLAMAKPVITGDSAAVRQVFVDGQDIYICERENPGSLAKAILNLCNDEPLRRQIAANASARYLSGFTPRALGELYLGHLIEVARRS